MKTDRDCVGCLACYNSCPKQAISVVQNKQGFYRPLIEKKQCINCGQCDRICDKVFIEGTNTPFQKGFAFSNAHKEVKNHSSSGGAFYTIAKIILEEGGIVYACIFQNGQALHTRISSINQLLLASGAKYVQSLIGAAFIKIKSDLLDNKTVLFVGTPCQCAGLKAFLGKEYDNLLILDFICHGVPSPDLLQCHLRNISKGRKIDEESVNFRDKRQSIKSYGLSMSFEDGSSYYGSNSKDNYLKLFNYNYFFQESCYKCKFKKIKCNSDITIGDIWNDQIKKTLSDEEYSLIIVNSLKGKKTIKRICSSGKIVEINILDELIVNNSRLVSSYKPSNADMLQSLQQCKEYRIPFVIRTIRKIIVLTRIYKFRKAIGSYSQLENDDD